MSIFHPDKCQQILFTSNKWHFLIFPLKTLSHWYLQIVQKTAESTTEIDSILHVRISELEANLVKKRVAWCWNLIQPTNDSTTLMLEPDSTNYWYYTWGFQRWKQEISIIFDKQFKSWPIDRKASYFRLFKAYLFSIYNYCFTKHSLTIQTLKPYYYFTTIFIVQSKEKITNIQTNKILSCHS